jgi:hypothetical protein
LLIQPSRKNTCSFLEKARDVIKGFPPSLRTQFSKRREEIEAVAESLGVTDQDGLQEITARSRKAKVQADGDITKKLRNFIEGYGKNYPDACA